MPYFFSILTSIISISTLAIFINKNIKINLNYSFLISSCLCSLFIYIGYIILPIFHLKYFIYSYIIITIFAAIQLIKKQKVTKENLNLLIEFLIITFLVSFFSWNKYYLDQDELDYWGIILKYFHFFQNTNFDNSYLFNLTSENSSFFYHKPFLSIFHFYNSFFSGFREDISIFSNNLLIISAFYFVFYHEKDSIYKRSFLLIIFYICLNNLSFGLVSIYADPIIATLYLSLIVHLYRTKDVSNICDIFIIFTLTISLFLLHRSGVIFILFAIYFWFILSNNKKKKIVFFLFNIVIFFIIFQFVFIKCSGFEFKCVFFEYDIFKHFLKNFLTIDIYFSDFGVSINSILSILGIQNSILPEFDIKVIFWLIIILLMLSYNYKTYLKIIFFILFQFFLYTFIIYTAKIQIDGLSILVYGRYIGIFLLSAILFCVYIYSINIKKYNNIILSFLLCFLIFITPNKTYGFFLTNNYFLKQEQNQNYWNHKQKIKKIFYMLKPNLETFVVEGSYKSKTTAYHPSMPFSLMNFEFYSINSKTKKIKTIKFSNYINEFYTLLNGNIVFYNLTPSEKKLLKKINISQNHIYLNFD